MKTPTYLRILGESYLHRTRDRLRCRTFALKLAQSLQEESIKQKTTSSLYTYIEDLESSQYDLEDLVLHTLIDRERNVQVFAFVDYDDEEMDEAFTVKVMSRCARDAKATNKGFDASGKRNFFVTEN